MLILPKKERECMGDFIVYIRFERNNEVSEKDVTIGSIADVFCDDKTLESKVNAIKLVHVAPKVKRDRIVFSVMDVIKKINDVELKNLAINCYSCLKENGKKINYMSYIKQMKNEECNKAIIRIFNNIKIEQIEKFIDEID